MTPIRFSLEPGRSIFDQVVFAAIRAFVGGELQAGDAFPSVRSLAADLKIHPNTAHKVIQHLVSEGWLEVRPGIGTIVAKRPQARKEERQRLLREDMERLVIEARKLGMSLEDVSESLADHWAALGGGGGR